MKNVLLFICSFITFVGFSQDKIPYQIFTAQGKKSNFNKMLQKSENANVVLFGEYHNNSIIHWLQLEFTKELFAKKNLILGAEMFEADNQKQLNEYLAGTINEKKLDSTARLWKNFKTDYKPLVDFAKDNKIEFVATNIPRKYASLVLKKGLEELENLSPSEKLFIAPLPIPFDKDLAGYKAMLEMQGSEHAGDKMPKAQAIKDATMAYFINKNRKENTIFIHYNGTYHSENKEGINWYLKKETPPINIITIATVEQKDISKLASENKNKANFIIVVDEDVIKTY